MLKKGMNVCNHQGGARRGETRASFVIVLWLEPQAPGAEPQWRWRVTCVQTGERAYFHRLSDVSAYVGRTAGVLPPG